jgi:hypothetical protein
MSQEIVVCLLTLCSAPLGPKFEQNLAGRLHPAVESAASNGVKTFSDTSGLRVVLPGDPTSPTYRLRPRFKASGDFEVTLAYDLLRADKPTEGLGAGVKIFARVQGGHAITIAHLQQAEGERQVVTIVNDRTLPKAEGYHMTRENRSGTSVSLRLERSGSRLRCLARDEEPHDNASEFQEISSHDISTGPLDELRFVVTTHGSAAMVDARLKYFSVRAADLPAKLPIRSPEWKWTIIPLVLCGVAAGVVYFWRRRRSARMA